MAVKENRVIYRHIDVDGWNPSIDCYMKDGGYEILKQTVGRNPAELCEEVLKSGIKGRGGAGFPMGMKWKFLDRKSGKPIYLVCNADESEPGTCVDREIIYKDPHQLIEGIMCTCFAIGAAQAFIYIRGEYINGYRTLINAINEAREKGFVGKNICGSQYSCEINVTRGAGCYICGEETGLLSSLMGGRAYPRLKPPYFPAVMGLYDCPTVVNNVKSLCWVPIIFKNGGEAISKIGSPADPGTYVWGVSGLVQKPGHYEITSGACTLGELLNEVCGGPLPGRSFKAVIPGGSSMKILRWDETFKIKQPDGTVREVKTQDIPLDGPSLMACGSALGSAGIIVMDNTTDMVEAMANINAFYAHESCGQCTPCREGSLWISKVTRRICEGGGRPEDVQLIADLADNIAGKTICAHGEGMAWPVQSSVAKFRDEYLAKIERQQAGEGRARLDKNSYRLI